MLSTIKNFFDAHIHAESGETADSLEHRLRVATVALLLETARAMGALSRSFQDPEEIQPYIAHMQALAHSAERHKMAIAAVLFGELGHYWLYQGAYQDSVSNTRRALLIIEKVSGTMDLKQPGRGRVRPVSTLRARRRRVLGAPVQSGQRAEAIRNVNFFSQYVDEFLRRWRARALCCLMVRRHSTRNQKACLTTRQFCFF